ncbi:MAG TPA: toll/interleukin-1 receptor domain-containing protein [Bryobacteraceae bacterium]|jgi:hypothetical protein
MAFVPGYKHDLFLSYAHDESAWAEAFRKALCAEFQIRTGEELVFWHDVRNLRTGQKWDAEIEEGIRNAAAFLAVLSPTYFKRHWCAQEYNIALENGIEALRVETFYRFLKVIKTPGPGNSHREFYEKFQDFAFFREADRYEIPEGSAEFTASIRELFRHIRELLTLIGNRSQELYLAPGAIEMYKERDKLERELKDRGFAMKPEVLLGPGFGKASVRNAMDKVSHVIFILGAEWDPFIGTQIEAAQELGKPVLFWVQPGGSQKSLAERMHGLYDGAERLGGHSIRELIPQLIEKIKPRKPVEAPAAGSGVKRVYVNHDDTLPEDSRLAAQVANLIRERKLEALQSGRDGDHDRLMHISNGVLVFRAANPNPDRWLRLNAIELVQSGQIFEKEPDFEAKALLVTDPARIPTQASGVPVYRYSQPFDAQTLDSFFARLQGADTANAGR